MPKKANESRRIECSSVPLRHMDQTGSERQRPVWRGELSSVSSNNQGMQPNGPQIAVGVATKPHEESRAQTSARATPF